MRNKDGTPNPIQENFDWKILLVYADKFIIMDSDQTPVFDRDATPGKIQRVIPFEYISLDCNKDGNKLCTIKEFQKIDPNF